MQASAQEVMGQDELEMERAELNQQLEASQPVSQDDATRGQQQGVTPPETLRPSPFSGTFAVDFRSQYNTFGIVIQGQGISTQPYLNLRYNFYNNQSQSRFVNNITGFVTTWNDFSSNTHLWDRTSPYGNFTEADMIVGVAAVVAQRVNLNLSLTSFNSPAGAYGYGAWTRATLLYDDSGLMRPNFAIKPQMSFIYSLPSTGFIGFTPSSWLYEPGITPNYSFRAGTPSPVNVALPMRLGLGSQFYGGSNYGYFSVGPQITMRLPALSTKALNTNLTLGYLYYNLGPTTASFAPNNNKNQHVFNIGLAINF